jgi:predicted MFS family arabinose efflux permease
MYVNVLIAAFALVGGVTLLTQITVQDRPHVDLVGTVLAGLGLFGLVYGFSNASMSSGSSGWTQPATLISLIGGAVLLAVFVFAERRVAHPLLPLRIILDRNRGGAYLAMFFAAIGMFGVFLFLTYYLQKSLGFSPVRSGLAFLPMLATLMLAATVGTAKLMPRMGPRPLVSVGLILATVGSVLLTRIGIHSSYDSHVLPALLLLGLGLGLTMAPAINTATAGIRSEDASVASAMVSVGQQIGGSVGTALLSSFAAAATTRFLTANPHTSQLLGHAAVHGYTTAFWWSAGIFAIGAVACGLLIPTHIAAVEEDETIEPEPAVAAESVFAR